MFRPLRTYVAGNLFPIVSIAATVKFKLVWSPCQRWPGVGFSPTSRGGISRKRLKLGTLLWSNPAKLAKTTQVAIASMIEPHMRVITRPRDFFRLICAIDLNPLNSLLFLSFSAIILLQ